MNEKVKNNMKGLEKKKYLRYESPKITTYTQEDILEQIGPAQACSPNPQACGSYD